MEVTDLIFWFCLALEFVAVIILAVVLILTILDGRKQKREEGDKWKRHEAMQLIRGTIAPFIGLINLAEAEARKTNDRT